MSTEVTSPRSRRSRTVRRLLGGLGIVLVLLLVVLAAGGWYFSGRIRSDGLEVRAYPTVRDLSLTPEQGGTVEIITGSAAELEMLRAPSTYGLKWRGGYGRVQGPVLQQSAHRVVRRLGVVQGRAPAAHTRAELDLAAFPEDPTLALGAGTRTVTYSSDRVSFPAWLTPGHGTGSTWAVLVHGKGGSRTEMARMGRATTAAGLTTLDIAYRNDPGTRRDPSGYYQYGRTEWRDLRGAVAYAGDHGARRVVLGADSMGGGIVASYLRHRGSSSEGPEVAGLVLDAPMLDFGATVAFGARQIALPVVGSVPQPLTWTAQRLATVRFGTDWSAVDYLSDSSWLRVPALVFHGTADTTVPLATSRRLARDRPGQVTLVTVPGAEHVRSWNSDPAAYAERVSRFVRDLDR